MQYSNAPPQKMKASVGIDSIFLQFKWVNKLDTDRFCRQHGWSYKDDEKKGEHTRRWKIFLAGGLPITAVYHFSTKTTTFQVGKLMNYSIKDEQHELLQKLMQYFSDRPVQISSLHFAVDVKEPIDALKIDSKLKLSSKQQKGSTVYLNYPNKTVMTVYDKAVQMQLYSTTSLTRFELRLSRRQLSQWNVRDFVHSRASLEKLASGIERYFEKSVTIYTFDKKICLTPDTGDVVKVLEDFIAFLHGGDKPEPKDHFKIRLAIQARDTLFEWIRNNKLRDVKSVNAFVKGKKAQCLKEIGVDHKTFNKAINFYNKGIPNFKIPA